MSGYCVPAGFLFAEPNHLPQNLKPRLQEVVRENRNHHRPWDLQVVCLCSAVAMYQGASTDCYHHITLPSAR